MKNIFFCFVFVWSSLLSYAQSGYQPGVEALDFSLKCTDGKKVSLKSYENAKGIILIFTCNHCPYSVAYEDRIIALHKKYAKQGFPVLAINPNDPKREPADSYENMVIRAKEKNFPFRYAIDETQNIARTYGATRTPHVFVLENVSGKWIVRYIGAIDDNSEEADAVTQRYVEEAVNALLEKTSISVPFTKAIGCTIKWRS